jgi:hypothetical protein
MWKIGPGSFPGLFRNACGHYKHNSIASTHFYLLESMEKVRELIAILIGFSIIFAGCSKRDAISGLPAIDKKEELVLETVPAKSLSEGCYVMCITAAGMYATACLAEWHMRLLVKRFSQMKKYLG